MLSLPRGLELCSRASKARCARLYGTLLQPGARAVSWVHLTGKRERSRFSKCRTFYTFGESLKVFENTLIFFKLKIQVTGLLFLLIKGV